MTDMPDLSAGPALKVYAMPKDANPAGDIFGGWLMSMIDLAGARIAWREAQGRVATVAVDKMSFLSPVQIGDEVSLYADLLEIGRSSIKVKVTAWAQRIPERGPHKVTEATITYVALDKDGKPRSVADVQVSAT